MRCERRQRSSFFVIENMTLSKEYDTFHSDSKRERFDDVAARFDFSSVDHGAASYGCTPDSVSLPRAASLPQRDDTNHESIDWCSISFAVVLRGGLLFAIVAAAKKLLGHNSR